jgi:hypothetical protein
MVLMRLPSIELITYPGVEAGRIGGAIVGNI